MAQEDDLRALGKIMDFLRAVSIILAIMNVYWYCYEAMHIWGVTIGVVDRILINFNRTGGLFHSTPMPPSSISLLNSQGKELDDIIDVKEVYRYKELLYGNTRAGGVNSGLWVVKFKAKDLGDNFKAAAETEVYDQPRSILYAVAVKNTYNTTDKAEEASTRRVTSEYGIDLNTTPAEPAWDFTVNETPISYIHNRYVRTESVEWTDQTTGYWAKTYAQELTLHQYLHKPQREQLFSV